MFNLATKPENKLTMNTQQKTTEKQELIQKLSKFLEAESIDQRCISANFKFWTRHLKSFSMKDLMTLKELHVNCCNISGDTKNISLLN